jgi:MFS family permease
MLLFAAGLYSLATLIRISMARVAARGHESKPQKLTVGSLKSNLGLMTGMLLAGGLLTWILLTDGIRDIAFALSFNLLPLYLEDIGGMSIQQIGWLESVFGIAMMAVTIPAGLLADKRGERLGIAMGFLLQSAALGLFLKAEAFWGYVAAWAVLGLGVGLMAPAYQALISKAVPEKMRGTAFGLFSTSLGLLSLPAPALGAQLWERFSPRLPFGLTAVAGLVSIIPVWLKFKLPARQNGDAEVNGEGK